MLHIPISIPPQSHQANCNLLSTFTPNKPHNCSALCRASGQNPLSLTNASSNPAAPLRYVGSTFTREDDKDETDRDRVEDEEEGMVASASAVAALIRKVSTSPVDFVQRIEQAGDGRDGGGRRRLVLPSVDFRRLCLEQLDLFRRIVHPDALLSVINIKNTFLTFFLLCFLRSLQVCSCFFTLEQYILGCNMLIELKKDMQCVNNVLECGLWIR